MTGKQIKAKLAAGGRVYGTVFFYTTNPAVVDVLPEQGLDFIMVHVEHNALDLADYLPMRYALKSKGIACIARTHSRDPEDVARICDTFPDGVVVPYVEDVEELKLLVGAAKYHPLKGPVLRDVIDHGKWPSEKTRAYVEHHCENTVFIPMIESPTAIANLEGICSVPGVDALLVGPNDLTVSHGIPEERDNPIFVDMMKKIIDTAAAHKVAAGGHFSRLEHMQRTIKQGGRLVVYSSDVRLIQFGIPQFLEQLGANTREGAETIV